MKNCRALCTPLIPKLPRRHAEVFPKDKQGVQAAAGIGCTVFEIVGQAVFKVWKSLG
jgi:hypothetical protein